MEALESVWDICVLNVAIYISASLSLPNLFL